MVLYNKRFGDQSVQMCLVCASGPSWVVEFEGMLYDGRARLELTDEISSQEADRPDPVRLSDGGAAQRQYGAGGALVCR